MACCTRSSSHTVAACCGCTNIHFRGDDGAIAALHQQVTLRCNRSSERDVSSLGAAHLAAPPACRMTTRRHRCRDLEGSIPAAPQAGAGSPLQRPVSSRARDVSKAESSEGSLEAPTPLRQKWPPRFLRAPRDHASDCSSRDAGKRAVALGRGTKQPCHLI
jgi:hypothetical protein